MVLFRERSDHKNFVEQVVTGRRDDTMTTWFSQGRFFMRGGWFVLGFVGSAMTASGSVGRHVSFDNEVIVDDWKRANEVTLPEDAEIESSNVSFDDALILVDDANQWGKRLRLRAKVRVLMDYTQIVIGNCVLYSLYQTVIEKMIGLSKNGMEGEYALLNAPNFYRRHPKYFRDEEIDNFIAHIIKLCEEIIPMVAEGQSAYYKNVKIFWEAAKGERKTA